MDLNVLITVAVIWVVAAVTPGPNFFITIQTSVCSNHHLSMFTVLGIVAGTCVWSISGFLGISILFQTIPMLYFSLKLFGALYLGLIGLKLIFKKKVQPRNTGIKSYTASHCFRLGLVTNLLNPKTAVFIASLFAATIPPSASVALGTLSVITICAISAIWYSIVALIFSHNKAKKSYKKQKKLIEKVAGTIFFGFGIKLAISK